MAIPAKIDKLIKTHGIKEVSLRITDLPGRWLHFSVPVSQVTQNGKLNHDIFSTGIAFDGSSPEGFKSIEQSDTLAVPDPDSAAIDPVATVPTLIFDCNLKEPETMEPYWRDPRAVAVRAEKYLQATKIADTAYFGPEVEFFIFDQVSWQLGNGFSKLNVVSKEGGVGVYEDPQNIYKVRQQEGYFVLPPYDNHKHIREEMLEALRSANIEIERDTHERATAGSAEIDLKYDSLLRMADKVMLFKYIVKNVAGRHDKLATFMPKPLFGHNGSGMHTHQSLWKAGKPIFYDRLGQYHHLSQIAMYYIGGLLTHAKALCALTTPGVNSYKRLVPGFEAPTTIAFGYRNRSTCARVPAYPATPASRRVEFRIPDPSANIYVCLSAMLMAGLDGIKRKLDPIKLGFGPLEKSGYDLSGQDAKKVTFTPSSLTETLTALEEDHEFLTAGNVFTKEFIQLWVDYKRQEIAKVSQHPSPADFEHYFDC